MNKTIIALAIAAALPVAAQADATISGSVTTKYLNTGVIDTDAALSIASSEVLANGMTATASFDILGGVTNSGTATLAGDFGTLTVGSIDSDAAFQAGDVAGVVSDTTSGSSATSVYGIHYAGTAAGLSIAAQLNATTGADAAGTETKGTQMSATYVFNDVTLGYAYASADADGGTSEGVNVAQTAFGASYSFGDLAITAGKSSVADDAVVSATYTFTADALTVKAQMDNDSDYQIDLTFVLSDSITIASEVDKGNDTSLTATYTAGDLTASVSKTDDGTTDASIALDLGNADLTLARDGGDKETSLTYKVAF